MGVELRTVSHEDVLPLLQMNVAAHQQDFVVHNAMTIAQAAFEPGATLFGIWAEAQLVGLTTVIDMRDYPFVGDKHDPMAGYIWRIMIDAPHQGQGYGRAALFRIEEWATELQLQQLFVAAVQVNAAALRLYRSVGYRPTGRVVAGEMELSKRLKPSVAARKLA